MCLMSRAVLDGRQRGTPRITWRPTCSRCRIVGFATKVQELAVVRIRTLLLCARTRFVRPSNWSSLQSFRRRLHGLCCCAQPLPLCSGRRVLYYGSSPSHRVSLFDRPCIYVSRQIVACASLEMVRGGLLSINWHACRVACGLCCGRFLCTQLHRKQDSMSKSDI